jgi:hypothetical protein
MIPSREWRANLMDPVPSAYDFGGILDINSRGDRSMEFDQKELVSCWQDGTWNSGEITFALVTYVSIPPNHKRYHSFIPMKGTKD